MNSVHGASPFRILSTGFLLSRSNVVCLHCLTKELTRVAQNSTGYAVFSSQCLKQPCQVGEEVKLQPNLCALHQCFVQNATRRFAMLCCAVPS